MGGLDEMVVGVGVVADKDTLVTRLDEGELCLRQKYFDKGTVARFWLEQESRHGVKSWWIATLGEQRFVDDS